MTELDFEELDKAVAGLMSNVDTNKRNTALDDPEDKVVTLGSVSDESPATPATSPAPSSPVTEPVAPVSSPVADPAPSAPTTTPLAAKRRGQFMDMIHPSSDMKSTPRQPSRQGVTIAPPSTPLPQVSAPAPLVMSDPVPTAPIVESAEPEIEVPEPVAEPTPEPIAADISLDTAADDSVAEPLSSPFLPDAKPEKRPLGGLAPSELSAPVDESAIPTPPPAEPDSLHDSLPAELHTDVLSVESNDLSNHTEEPEVASETVTTGEVPAPVIENVSEPAAVVEEQAPMPDVVPAETTTVPAGGSIAQQYTESPSTGDQTNGSIYDTAAYHQPITAVAPVKKKSSPLKWILIALGLIVLGGGAGVGYFLLTH